MTYTLDPEAKAFSVTLVKSCLSVSQRIVAHPHTAITTHDQARALSHTCSI
jgi:hypothetical protein